METVDINQFRKNIKKYLNELPITLTRYGYPVALVVPPAGVVPTEESKREKFEELKEGLGKSKHTCSHCRSRIALDQIVRWTTADGEYESWLCQGCKANLIVALDRAGGSLL